MNEEELLECPECGKLTAYIRKDNPHCLVCNLCGMEWTIERPEGRVNMNAHEEIKLNLMALNYIKEGELHINLDLIADWVIKDRARIVEPLVKYKKGKAWGNTFICEAIDETLKLAGLSEGATNA